MIFHKIFTQNLLFNIFFNSVIFWNLKISSRNEISNLNAIFGGFLWITAFDFFTLSILGSFTLSWMNFRKTIVYFFHTFTTKPSKMVSNLKYIAPCTNPLTNCDGFLCVVVHGFSWGVDVFSTSLHNQSRISSSLAESFRLLFCAMAYSIVW